MSGIAQLVGGLNPAGGDVPNVSNPFDLNALLNMGLSPVQQSLVDFFGGEQDERTRDIYARLGLGGSTMLAQDLGGNELARLAKSADLIGHNQQLGLATQQGTLGVEQARVGAQNQAFNQGQTNLKNITGGLGSLASAAGSLFG
jgi:hypothetical protein